MTSTSAAENGSFAGERGPDFAAKRDAYNAARAEQAELIDNPDKTITVYEYIERIAASKRKVRKAHNAMLRAWALG